MGEKIRFCEILLCEKRGASREGVRPNLHRKHETLCELPKYRRHELESNRDERRDSRTLHTEKPRDYGKLHLDDPEINGKKRRKEVWVEKRGKFLC